MQILLISDNTAKTSNLNYFNILKTDFVTAVGILKPLSSFFLHCLNFQNEKKTFSTKLSFGCSFLKQSDLIVVEIRLFGSTRLPDKYSIMIINATIRIHIMQSAHSIDETTQQSHYCDFFHVRYSRFQLLVIRIF